VAFPNISTGVYHFPKPLAAQTAVNAVKIWLEASPGALDTVLFVCFGPENLMLYQELLGH
jgi:O-acetyl-ADP-ribose deacetylase (regulator of RNase III)